jgi:hypothetical protein
MQKTITQLVSTVAGKVGLLHVDCDTPIQVVKDMLFEFLTYVGNVEAQIKAQQAAVQVTEPPTDAAQIAVPAASDTESQPVSASVEQPAEPQAS